MPGPAAPRTPRPIAWVDGRVLPASEATVPLLDDGFLRGDAVFDAMLVQAGKTHARDAHLARLRTSGKAMGIRIPVVKGLIRDLLAAWGEQDGALKIVVTRNGTLRGILSPRSWPPVLSLVRVEMPWTSPIASVKTTSYAQNMWALRRAKELFGDDALITSDGIVMELPTGTPAWIRDGQLFAPDPSKLPILPSVTLRELQKVADVELGVWDVGDVESADEVFVVSATRPVLPVNALDEVEYEAPGPGTADLTQRFAAHIDATLDPLP